jgi:outer membrane protein OmpA-like peptidoglycan-associated protein
MRVRLLVAAGVLSFVPAIVRAQDVPAAAPVQGPAAPVAAHRGGSVEFSLGGGFSLVDKAFNTFLSGPTVRVVNDAILYGQPSGLILGGQFRLTWNLTTHFGLGVGAGVTNGNGALLTAPFGALTYTLDLNRSFSPFIEVGGGLTRFSAYTGSPFPKSSDSAQTAFGAFGGLGVRAMLGGALALRIEGRMSYDQFSGYSKNPVLTGAGFIGLSLFVGGRPPRDRDGDGVPDKSDACADTPLGATVDAQGCALDSDRDGVYDGLDQCADTPAGATVDAQGCALDSDRDGVYDGLDRCPATPAGVTVDANGCPMDSDADGVFDSLDRCANTPANARPVNANGCPRDTDLDNVPDYLDRCPNTPANARPVNAAGCPVDTDADGVDDYLDRCANTAAGTQVDANGCPVLRDSDNDGVTDDRDSCANTPPRTRVDATGCPTPEQPAAAIRFVLRNLTFRARLGRTAVSPSVELDSVAASLRAAPDGRWEIAGYTDNRGIPARNQLLSRQRAAAVMQYLIGKGVPFASLTARGYGANDPVASNATVTGRTENRRIEIRPLP